MLSTHHIGPGHAEFDHSEPGFTQVQVVDDDTGEIVAHCKGMNAKREAQEIVSGMSDLADAFEDGDWWGAEAQENADFAGDTFADDIGAGDMI